MFLYLSNVDFEWIGRGVVVVFLFAIALGLCYGVSAGIKKAYRNYKNRKTREYLSHKDLMKTITIQDLMKLRKTEVPEKDKDDFFFGPVSDWSKWNK